LDQYKRWDPSKGELAWGYHSVKTLIDAAYNDPHVYLDMLDNDPTNPDNAFKDGLLLSAAVEGISRKEEEDVVRMNRTKERPKGREPLSGMFPSAWKSSRNKNTNMLLEDQRQQEHERECGGHEEKASMDLDEDDELIGLHRKVPPGIGSGGNDVNSLANNDWGIIDMSAVKTKEVERTSWDEKETNMQMQVLKAFNDATQRPEGREYHSGIPAMGTDI